MVLSSSALTESSVEFIRGYSRILLIIQKSKYIISLPSGRDLSRGFFLSRVLLATIRDKGSFPCPQCLIPKSKLDGLGLRRDISVRVKHFRQLVADKVRIARNAIYNLGKSIRSKAVEDLLKGFSGVPTVVSRSMLAMSDLLTKVSSERICRMPWPNFQPIRYARC